MTNFNVYTITRKRNEQLHNDFYIIQRYINTMERKDYFEKITWIAICFATMSLQLLRLKYAAFTHEQTYCGIK